MSKTENDLSQYKAMVREHLVDSKKVSSFRRVLCVWLRILSYKTEQIAEMIGWSVSNVQKVQSLFLREGVNAFKNPGRGGGRHRHLSEEEEIKFINSLRDRQTGMIYLDIIEIKERFEKYAKLSVGSVSRSTIYRLLKRHGYKKGVLNGKQAFYK